MNYGIKLLFTLLCMASASGAQAQHHAIFDWFEYEGQDSVFDEELAPGHYRNPVLAGFHPDPSVVRVGQDYYLVTSTFAWWPGLPVFHSRDLVNWEKIGYALSRRSQLTFENSQGMSRGLFAPTIRFHEGTFYIINTDVDGIGNFLITAGNPAGPWSDPIRLPEIDGIDPDLFFDDDGRVYIAHNGPPPGEPLYMGHRAIWLWEFDLDNHKLIEGTRRLLVNGGVDISTKPIWIEAPHLYKANGWYYLSCAEGGTEDGHSQVVFRARSLEQEFVPYAGNPILTQRDLDPDRPEPVTSTGHADLVQTPEGDWWALFLGVRPYDGKHHNTGRETFLLPVRWEDGWPRILAADSRVARQPPLPLPESTEPGTPPQSGNFTWRDDFDRPALNLEWSRVRTSDREWLALEPEAGQVRLEALPLPLNNKAQPAFLARRQQHMAFTASTQLRLPLDEQISAGLAAFQSSDFNFFLGVRKVEAGHEVFVESVNEGHTSTLASQFISETGPGIVLGVQQHDDKLDFFTQMQGKRTWLLRNADATLLSTQVAGGFVGTMLGIHAREEPTGRRANFEDQPR